MSALLPQGLSPSDIASHPHRALNTEPCAGMASRARSPTVMGSPCSPLERSRQLSLSIPVDSVDGSRCSRTTNDDSARTYRRTTKKEDDWPSGDGPPLSQRAAGLSVRLVSPIGDPPDPLRGDPRG